MQIKKYSLKHSFIKDAIPLKLQALTLVQTTYGIQASICYTNLRSTTNITYSKEFIGECNSLEAINDLIKKIKYDLASHQINCPNHISLCLTPEKLIIKKWVLPFILRTKIKNSLAIMLNAELPFPSGNIIHKFFFPSPFSFKKNTAVFTFSCEKTRIKLWQNALENNNLYTHVITFSPCALINPLAKLTGSNLCIHEQGDFLSLFYIEKHIVQHLRVIQKSPLSHSDTSKTVNIFIANMNMALHGLPLSPDQVILLLETKQIQEYQKGLHTHFNVPVISVQQSELSLGLSVNEYSSSKMLTNIMAQNAIPIMYPKPMNFQEKYHKQNNKQLQTATVLFFASTLLLLFFTGVLWMQTNTIEQQNSMYENQIQTMFQEAVPEIKNAMIMRQMRSILNAKITNDNGNSKTAYTVLTKLRDIHAKIAPDVLLEVNSIHFTSTLCQIRGTLDSYESLDKIQKSISEMTDIKNVKIIQASNKKNTHTKQKNVQGDAIVFELTIEYHR